MVVKRALSTRKRKEPEPSASVPTTPAKTPRRAPPRNRSAASVQQSSEHSDVELPKIQPSVPVLPKESPLHLEIENGSVNVNSSISSPSPLQPEVIELIDSPKSTYGEAVECSICLSNDFDEWTVLSCPSFDALHAFHTACWKEWEEFSKQKDCPICRCTNFTVIEALADFNIS
jgi:Zinc finger, C3HC4 type (RING finger)